MRKIFRLIKKVWRYLRRKGFSGACEFIDNATTKNDVLGFYNFIVDRTEIPLDRSEFDKQKNSKTKILNWIIPEMGKGSGGHTTIFRFISNLEELGFHSRVYLFRSQNFNTNESIRNFLKEYFPILDSRVEIFCDVNHAGFAHATFATSWDTAYFVRRFNNTISKYYFVQDFEPQFFAVGSEYEFAENTYKMGLRAITAGDWLRDMLRSKYGMKAESFSFSYDKDIYIPGEKKDNTKRVFFYARPVTPRRDFELGLLALNELNKRIDGLEVIFAGWDISNYEIPFIHQNRGVVTMQELADIYRQCDLCLAISNTNLSLVPLEIMACGAVAVCSKGENSSWLVNDENAVLVDYDPIEIAETMAYYLNNPEELESKRKKGLEFAQKSDWKKEAVKVHDAVLAGIEEDLASMEN